MRALRNTSKHTYITKYIEITVYVFRGTYIVYCLKYLDLPKYIHYTHNAYIM